MTDDYRSEEWCIHVWKLHSFMIGTFRSLRVDQMWQSLQSNWRQPTTTSKGETVIFILSHVNWSSRELKNIRASTCIPLIFLHPPLILIYLPRDSFSTVIVLHFTSSWTNLTIGQGEQTVWCIQGGRVKNSWQVILNILNIVMILLFLALMINDNRISLNW